MRWSGVLGVLLASTAAAQTGPGLGNSTYRADQVFEPIGFIESPQGHGNVTMVQGYLMVIYSSDGGGNATNGGIEFWDVSDPTSPSLVIRHEDANTRRLREAHGFSLAWIGGRLVLAAQTVVGVQLWDVTNPRSIALLSDLDLPDIDPGDYSGGWWLFWQAPHLFLAGVDSGLYVVDASDPAAPRLAHRMSTGALGGVSPAQVFAVGNLAVVMESQGRDFATLDISDPLQPRLRGQFPGRLGYSHLFAGDGKILTSGNIPPQAHVFDVTHDGDIRHRDTIGLFFDSGGYGSYQDGAFHSGFSDNYQKFSLNPPRSVGSGSSGRTDRDEDFSTVLGNLVFVGDDHGEGTALIPHQRDPDTTPPAVEWMHPQQGSAGVALTTRVGLSFSDHIDVASLTPDTAWIEDQGGNKVAAILSAQQGIVNIAPAAALRLLTNYRVVVQGVRDLAGNAAPRWTADFATGNGSTAGAPTAAVTDVEVNLAIGRYALAIFDQGKKVYSDRDYTFTANHPARFRSQAYLQTANVDRINFVPNFLRFRLLAPAEVAVLYDARASAAPTWLRSFNQTQEAVQTTDTTFDVFTKDFPVGEVTLGGNSGLGSSGARSMYSVVIVPEALPCRVDLSPVITGTVTLTATGPSGATYRWRVSGQVLTGANPQVHLPPGRHPVFVTVTRGPLSKTCGGVKIAHHPLVSTPARTATKLVWAGPDTLNVNPDNGTVTRVSGADRTVLWEREVGRRPVSLTLAGDEVWVVDQDEAAVKVLSATSGALTRTIALPRGSAPHAIVRSGDDTTYVTLTATGEVVAIDDAGTIVDKKHVTPTARGLTWFDGRLYVTRFISPDERGEVYVVDPTTLETTGVVHLAFDPGPDTEATGRGVPNYVAEVTVSPDGRRAFVASKKDNIARGLWRDGEALTFESRVRAIVSVFDPATGQEDPGARRDINDREMVQSTLTSPLGDLLFVASQGENTVDVFDVAAGERISQFPVGRAPQAMALDADGGRLAVYNFLGRSVHYFDVSSLLSGASNAVTDLGAVTTVASEKLAPLVLTGKRVFHDASDERMSRDGYMSCASCHLDGGHDGRTWDFTQSGEGLRNTIPLTGRGGVAHGNVHWTANFDEIQDFENDIRAAFGGTGFLDDDDFVRTADPLGAPKAGLSPELDALAAYVATLDTAPPSPHRAPDGTLTEAARRGRVVFADAGCASCHASAAFSDFTRHDVGTSTTSSGQGISRPLAGAGFETPTLLGAWSSPPYLHDGSAPDLAAALDRHGDTSSLSGEARADLIAYLRQLDSTSLAPEAPCDAGPDECVEATNPPAPDAGAPSADAATMDAMAATPAADAGVAVTDAGTPAAPDVNSGCKCDTHGPTGDDLTSVTGWALALATLARRRRRRRPTRSRRGGDHDPSGGHRRR